MTEPLLVVERLWKRFPRPRRWPWQGRRMLVAVRDVSLTVAAGGSLGIVGESGCGKTTLARMLVGLLRPTAGEIRLDGRPVWAGGRVDRAVRRRLQMVFQDPAGSLNPRKTVRQLIEAPLIGLSDLDARRRLARVEELMGLVGLGPDLLHRHPHEVSGGQGQRIGIARALAASADVIVLDEPVSALDVSIQAQILTMLDDLRQRLGLTYVFISHDLSVVNHVCDRVAVMQSGEVVEQGLTAQVLHRPGHAYTRELLDSLPGARLARFRASGCGG
jgi:peptide/nickel transport system ATP-binding protein